ncbi:GreA/GreB family elongation factor [Rubrivirga sp.]|uniref:GreA/GreB family elongation factor n=1 Tax=Rubrivirga sp. TaxID=1885344 RepID=UPI003C784852
MSRAFVKEGAPEVPLVVPPRPPLPDGVPNYVTPTGLVALRAEKSALEAERRGLEGDADESTRQREWITGRLRDLVERIARSKVVDPSTLERSDVRFGATVTILRGGDEQTFQIVGVDEASARDDAVAFTSPIARAVLAKSAGDAATLSTPKGEDRLEVVAVQYA